MLTARANMVGEPELRARWERRVVEGRFSPVVAGVRQLTVFGPNGEPLRAFPQLRAASMGESRADLIAALSAEERWALACAEHAVARGREVFVVARTRGVGELLRSFDPAESRDILILAPNSR